MKRLLQALMAIAALLHVVQLVLYPVDPKWFVALVGGVVYSAAAYGIHRNARFGYLIAAGFPLLAAVFVAAVLLIGPPPVPGGIKFNPFTALAAAVELPAVVLAFGLIRRREWQAGPS